MDGKQGQRPGGVIAAVIGAQVDPQHGHARIHRAKGVVLTHFIRVQIVIARPGLHRAVTGQAPHLPLTGSDARRSPVAVGADHRFTDALAQEPEQRRIEAGGVGAEGVVEIAAQVLPRAGVGVGDQQAQPPGRHVGGGGDAFRHGVVQRQGTGAQIKLHQRHGRLAGAMQIKRARLQAGTETVGVFRPGGIAEFGQADGRCDVHFRDAGQGLAASGRG